jgi:hypothetical protein
MKDTMSDITTADCSQIYVQINYTQQLFSPGTLYHYRASANNSNAISYGSDRIFLTQPMLITSFSAVVNNPNEIELSWMDGIGGDGAYIEYSTQLDTQWMPGDHLKIDDDGYVMTPFLHTGLQPGETYYYKAWAYAEDKSIRSDGSSSRPFNTNPITVDTNLTSSLNYNLSVNINGSGFVYLNPAGGEYQEGTVVELNAIENLGWEFSHWTGDINSSINPVVITMDSNKTITAQFINKTILLEGNCYYQNMTPVTNMTVNITNLHSQ